jgi:hypothetical protein
MSKRINVVLPETLRERLKREAIAKAGRDVEMAAEWFPLEEEAATGPAVALG